MKKQQESLKNMVYQAILNGIFTDEYKPNQIINEQELVQKFGCSKTPIREALVTLCNEGILRSFPRFGYQVVSVSREEAQNILDFVSFLKADTFVSRSETSPKKTWRSSPKSTRDASRAPTASGITGRQIQHSI